MTVGSARSTIPVVDADEPRARFGDLLASLTRQDLDPLSLAELDARIAALRAEIARVEAHKQRAVNHKAIAEDLFRQ